ncbi:hypothetical protein [Kangiella sediminilitoris]|uniref:Knr4/Smi1-like domain-containing protein n=1 Tax=Kangiella sediminilitoris TaxID=1144748 RepID=A0A1B3BDT3_9GAMM|nr:hypothetical protein [Kangiella sediminilitoris]AOE50928.1 hypothetical protein KS2013_2223 [Kangiella sediminilitoris]
MDKELLQKIKGHHGEFLCEAIGSESKEKIVRFKHHIEPPQSSFSVPNIGGLREFYDLASSLTLYSCEKDNEAAFYIAKPEQWETLENEFSGWTNMLDEDEKEAVLPDWYGEHIVIGEIPASGNYILVITDGFEAGATYEFEHDGFEFIKLGNSITDFVQKALDPDEAAFTNMASHMRFIDGESDQQWWARELRHHHGKVITNNV